MVGCLVISHGKIAEAFIEASQKIVGESEYLYTMNCDELTAKELQQKMARLIESEGLQDGLFVLVSLKGGSCWNAAMRVSKEFENVRIISGMNLPLLLSFITKRKNYTFEELSEILVRDGIRGISTSS